MLARTAIFLGLLALPGCATIMEGSSQSVSIETTPTGALCNVDRQGSHLGTVADTPGSLRLDKSKNDITITCTKDGYQKTSITESPKFVGTTFGNIIAGGVIGVAVDAASGANYEYPGNVHLDLATMEPSTTGATTIAPTATTSSAMPSGQVSAVASGKAAAAAKHL